MDSRSLGSSNPWSGLGENMRDATSSKAGGLASLFSGLFGGGGDPYRKAEKEYGYWSDIASNKLNPFYNQGIESMGDLSQWIKGMKDPSEFINKLMGGYQESPYAHLQQDQATRSARNLGSASGLTGSTPLTQFAQQNARDISSEDMGKWLERVLGINTQYGQGLAGLTGQGFNAAQGQANIFGQRAQDLAGLEYGKERENNMDFNRIIGGLINLAF